MKNPCRYCEERHIGCHAKCEKYLEQYEKRKAQQAERMKSFGLRQYFHDESLKKLKKVQSRQKG